VRKVMKRMEKKWLRKKNHFWKGKLCRLTQTREKEKKDITDEEACENFRFIQQSEYKVVNKLNRMPARVSLLELLMHSPSHRELLMKILNTTHMEHDISLDKFEGIVSHITANNYFILPRTEYLQRAEDIIKLFIFQSNAWTISYHVCWSIMIHLWM